MIKVVNSSKRPAIDIRARLAIVRRVNVRRRIRK
jgi:hypothetical protein